MGAVLKLRGFAGWSVHSRKRWHRQGKSIARPLMRQPVSLTIPQPCHQSWSAMTPATAGRHCAACEKTVVDFTLKTDAEILAFLAGAARGRTCGRFTAGQLERPLQRPAPAAPSGRWRAWLAAAVARQVKTTRQLRKTSQQAPRPIRWERRATSLEDFLGVDLSAWQASVCQAGSTATARDQHTAIAQNTWRCPSRAAASSYHHQRVR